MPLMRKWSLAAVAAVVIALGSPAAFAGNVTLTMSMTPTSGPPGTAVTVSSVAPCPSTDGVYDVMALVGDQADLVNGPALGSQDVGDGGPWSIGITIPSDAAVGSNITIYAICQGTPTAPALGTASPNAAAGAVTLATYTPITFSVTAPATTTTTSTTAPTTTTTAVVTTTTSTPPGMTAVPDFMYPGESCLITAHGFAPSSDVTVTVYSDPLVVGTFATDANGTLSTSWTVPSGFAAGAHTVVLTGRNIAGAVQLSAPITVGAVVQQVTTQAPTTAAVITTSGNLPTTGSNLTQPLVLGAVVLLAGGGTALAVSRRRTRSR